MAITEYTPQPLPAAEEAYSLEDRMRLVRSVEMNLQDVAVLVQNAYRLAPVVREALVDQSIAVGTSSLTVSEPFVAEGDLVFVGTPANDPNLRIGATSSSNGEVTLSFNNLGASPITATVWYYVLSSRFDNLLSRTSA